MNNNDPILLFDGICNLCNSLVIFIIKKDPKSKFKFAALQSSGGQTLLKKFGLPSNDLNSIVYIKGKKYFLKSTAVLYTLKDLGGFWKLSFVFIIVPKFIRNIFYNLIAKSRYRIFGKRDTCMVPDPQIFQRFIFYFLVILFNEKFGNNFALIP